MTKNKISSLIKAAAILAVSMSSYAQDRAAVGFRLGVQQWTDICKLQTFDDCKSRAPLANPYVRLHIDGPHSLEVAGRFALADYRGDGTLRTTNSNAAYATEQLRTGYQGLSLSYEHRPLEWDVAFRVGWHYTETEHNVAVRYLDSSLSRFDRDVSHEEKLNGFLVGVGFYIFRGANLSVDWTDLEEYGETYSMLLGFEI